MTWAQSSPCQPRGITDVLQAAAELLTKTIRQRQSSESWKLPTSGEWWQVYKSVTSYLEERGERRETCCGWDISGNRQRRHLRVRRVSVLGGRQDFCPETFLENQTLGWLFTDHFYFQNFYNEVEKDITFLCMKHRGKWWNDCVWAKEIQEGHMASENHKIF